MDYCEGCPRRGSVNPPGYPGTVGAWGELDAPVLVVGMSPGREELAAGEPFVGASGTLLWGYGGKVGLTRADCRIVNTASCWPCGPKGKTLSRAQVEACRPRLEDALRTSQARVVLCLGADAFDAVTGLISWERVERKARAARGGWSGGHGVGIEQWRGYLVAPEDCPPTIMTETRSVPDYNNLYKTSKKGKYAKGDPRPRKVKVRTEVPRVLPPRAEFVIGTYHPSFVMRMGRKPIPAFYNDVARVVRALHGNLDTLKVEYETRVP